MGFIPSTIRSTLLEKILFTLPRTEFCSCIAEGIRKILAANMLAAEGYPPNPIMEVVFTLLQRIIILIRLFVKNQIDLKGPNFPPDHGFGKSITNFCTFLGNSLAKALPR
jgi:hypothetical protein